MSKAVLCCGMALISFCGVMLMARTYGLSLLLPLAFWLMAVRPAARAEKATAAAKPASTPAPARRVWFFGFWW